MKNKSDIVKWDPIEEIPQELYVEKLSDDYDGLVILLKGSISGSEKIIKIVYDHYYTYRNTNESYRLKMQSEFPIICEKWSLFYSKNSELIDWIKNESQGVYDREEMVHFIIVSPEDIIEVVSIESPTVEII